MKKSFLTLVITFFFVQTCNNFLPKVFYQQLVHGRCHMGSGLTLVLLGCRG